jgi:hypothetical protein
VAIECFEKALELDPPKRQYYKIRDRLRRTRTLLELETCGRAGSGEQPERRKGRREVWMETDLEEESAKAKAKAEKRRRQRLKKTQDTQTAHLAEAARPLGPRTAMLNDIVATGVPTLTQGRQVSQRAGEREAKERAEGEAEAACVQAQEQREAKVRQQAADKLWLQGWLDAAGAGRFYDEFVSRGWTNRGALTVTCAAGGGLVQVMQHMYPARKGVEAFRFECALHQLLFPGETPVWTEKEMRAWDDGDERNTGVVEAWLGTLDFAVAELAALVDVDLEGEDLAEATDESLKGLCKKTAKQAQHKGLNWTKMRVRLISARDVALGRPANGLRIGVSTQGIDWCAFVYDLSSD